METTSVQPAAGGGSAPSFAAITALIVDDEPHVRAYLRLVLVSLGVTTAWEAENGAQALELYRLHQPSVMLLDINMPVMSGDKVMQELAQIDPEAAVIMVTAENELETVKRYIRLGAMGYVLKFLPREKITIALTDMLRCLIDEEAESD